MKNRRRMHCYVTFWACNERTLRKGLVLAQPDRTDVMRATARAYGYVGNLSVHSWAPADGWEQLEARP